jgi:hypothetical protein
MEGQTCGTSLEGIPLIEDSEVFAASADNTERETSFYDGTVREFQHADETAHAFLECPWGPLRIVGALGIGRDMSFCPEAARFSGYVTVSGVHARIFYSDRRWFVRDLGSTNGTFLNGVQIGSNEDHGISDGDQVHFSKSFSAFFRAGKVHK